MERFSRTISLLGERNFKKIRDRSVIVFGLGGVGGFVCEAFARSGVGRIDVVDSDVVSKSNINRQVIALSSTVGMKKTTVQKARILDINPDCVCEAFDVFYKGNDVALEKYDYIVDAIDTVTSKLSLIKNAANAGVPIISSMGTGNKYDPMSFKIADINKTSVCPLARVMRRELKQTGINKLTVLYSTEPPVTPETPVTSENGRHPPASIAYVPSVAGFLIAKYVIESFFK